ncbi:hypothetical protein DEU56DRAFT_788845 [Suillus clintonianus]|uniref:uncharacterized protein n=1 Tax=Suillus clintonianus TaxID=1904413 RepID=UPI001B85EB27|nr:uncharacterized protein DEU56DRAFT_788845 [Suillus clintonianus]KAG2145115.1 hypothetical protein DEU56DRAFT_788845 [Suillus clintonianus]
MYPYYSHQYFRGPSRILWFMLGAGAATFWNCGRQMRENRAHYFPCVMQARRVEGSGEQPNTPPVSSKSDAPASQEHRWNFIYRNQPDRNGDGTAGWNQREWEEDKERLKEIQKRTEDAMLDMSESTLESIISTVESLKNKLAQHKIQREQQQKKYEEELERQKKNPPRFV